MKNELSRKNWIKIFDAKKGIKLIKIKIFEVKRSFTAKSQGKGLVSDILKNIFFKETGDHLL
ncbi:hypothetical protein [Lactiplantibacillus plantarum]|uniref:hypothetical protein n=1 Tax=Lactiplantibacillus plantarum TaxID=1590 RepID=UPI001F2A6F10|nr:hypothetical protein [Lactiplantibacillus plantarum]UJM23195.1 hypothetical protein L1599_08590 [Lactiplantibacillus plantarum]